VEAEERDAVAQRRVRARCSSDCFAHGNGGARRWYGCVGISVLLACCAPAPCSSLTLCISFLGLVRR
jgi:hypothetical protein